MKFEQLTQRQGDAWCELLAISFSRTSAEMADYLDYLHGWWPLIAYGAWDGRQLVAQYSCLLRPLAVPERLKPVQVGMSINMAVHPAYRGRGLVKQVARPVYEAVQARGGLMGVGFSNAAGVRVDRRSAGYGYRVLGRLQPWFGWLRTGQPAAPVALTNRWPGEEMVLPDMAQLQFAETTASISHRYGHHPHRKYHFATWPGQGIVVYRPLSWGPFSGLGLLAAYGLDLRQLLAGVVGALRRSGYRFVHVLSTPGSELVAALRASVWLLPLPVSRQPYYLTAKPLVDVPESWLDINRWHCLGGDVA